MSKRTVPKEVASKLGDSLDDQVSYEEIIHKLCILKCSEEGMADVEEGRTKSHDEAREELGMLCSPWPVPGGSGG